MIRNSCLAVLPVFLLLSCSENQTGQNAAETIAKPAMGGELRGVSIGDDAESILRVEPGESLYNMPDQIVYRLPLDEGGGAWYEINYNLNERGVYDIALEIFPKDSNELKSVSADLLQLYQEKYGPAMREHGFFTWKVMSEEDRVITVSLTDTLIDQQKSIIRVHFTESE